MKGKSAKLLDCQLFFYLVFIQFAKTANIGSQILQLQIKSMFGKQRLADFYVDPKYININHGSYGYSPKTVIQYRRSVEEEGEFNTDKWFRRESEMYINEMRSYIASKINCPTKNLFIVQNATDAINCIAKSIQWSAGDVVLLPNIAYACVRKTFNVLRDRYGITILDLNFTAQDFKTAEKIQIKVEDFVNSYPKKIKMAVMDHISSMPSVVFPIQTLQAFFQEKNIAFVVDGAHAIGNIRVNIGDITPNAYFSNFHKWSFCPKNASFLYLDDNYRDLVKPIITGNFSGEGPEREFYWTGTRDFSSYLTIRKGIEYHESFGVNSVMTYNHDLAFQAAKRMAEIWGTKLLTEDRRILSSMVCVQVPSSDYTLCHKLAMDMLYEVNCFPHFTSFDGKVYCRLSAQIYNQLSDYEFAAKKFLEYLNKFQAEAQGEKTIVPSKQ